MEEDKRFVVGIRELWLEYLIQRSAGEPVERNGEELQFLLEELEKMPKAEIADCTNLLLYLDMWEPETLDFLWLVIEANISLGRIETTGFLLSEAFSKFCSGSRERTFIFNKGFELIDKFVKNNDLRFIGDLVTWAREEKQQGNMSLIVEKGLEIVDRCIETGQYAAAEDWLIRVFPLVVSASSEELKIKEKIKVIALQETSSNCLGILKRLEPSIKSSPNLSSQHAIITVAAGVNI